MDRRTGVAAAAWRYVLSLHREGPAAQTLQRGSRSKRRTGPDNGRDETLERTSGADAPHIEVDDSDESTAAATQAAMAHVLARPDSIRQRAQSAATISSAAAAALAVASIAQLTGNGDEDWGALTVGVVWAALVLWIVSVWRFIHVVSLGPHRSAPEGPGYQALVNVYEAYSDLLRQQLRSAGKWSAVALAATVVAVGLEIGERAHTGHGERQMVLTPAGMSAVASLCGWGDGTSKPDPRVNVRVSSEQLSKQVVELEVVSRPAHQRGEPVTCDATSPTMHLPRAAIVGTKDIDVLNAAFTAYAHDRFE